MAFILVSHPNVPLTRHLVKRYILVWPQIKDHGTSLSCKPGVGLDLRRARYVGPVTRRRSRAETRHETVSPGLSRGRKSRDETRYETKKIRINTLAEIFHQILIFYPFFSVETKKMIRDRLARWGDETRRDRDGLVTGPMAFSISQMYLLKQEQTLFKDLRHRKYFKFGQYETKGYLDPIPKWIYEAKVKQKVYMTNAVPTP